MTAPLPRPGPAAHLARLLRPATIAAVGGDAAAELVRQCEKIGFDGQIWPVHPRATEVAGRRAYRTIADLPAPPDAAFIGVNRHASIDVMAELSAAGTGGAVAFASGFAEAGDEGRELQARLIEAANGMPFFGPNCYGFINYFDQVLVWPDQHGGIPTPRGVAIITQSGNIGLNLTMQKRGLPIGYLITLGNSASVDHATAIHAVLGDPRVTAIGLHLEGLNDPPALAAAAARARAQGVPIVALKTGRSEAGARMALSHTASLGSADAVVDAFFRRIGIARVDTIPTLLEALKLLHVQGKLPGRTIASLSCSGGEAALIADAASAAGLQFVPLSPAASADIAATLPELVSVANPLDYHTFGWRNRPALAATFAAMMRAGADLNMLILDFPRPDKCETADWDIAAEALADAADATGRRAAILATLPEALPEANARAMTERGIVPLFGMVEALHAIAAAADVGGFSDTAPTALSPAGPLSGRTATLSEWDGKRHLASFGVNVPHGGVASSVDAAAEAALTIGFPVAIKAVGSTIAHKTERGAVRLHIGTAAEARAAAEQLLPLAGRVLVERMVSGTIAELIVGVARDPALGLYLMLGSGGVLAELVGDTATLLLPATPAEVARALATLRVARLLHGYRGGPPGDIAAAIDAVLAIQDFAMAHAHDLLELDVNPLMVRGVGQGAIAADVLMRLALEATDD
ncbi:MAG: acetate--CoA ligase family protein [Rhodospirillales bacterium]